MSANPSTRQQLDELDALLQRMLSLPLNDVDADAPAPATAPPPAAHVAAPAVAMASPPRPAPQVIAPAPVVPSTNHAHFTTITLTEPLPPAVEARISEPPPLEAPPPAAPRPATPRAHPSRPPVPPRPMPPTLPRQLAATPGDLSWSVSLPPNTGAPAFVTMLPPGIEGTPPPVPPAPLGPPAAPQYQPPPPTAALRLSPIPPPEPVAAAPMPNANYVAVEVPAAGPQSPPASHSVYAPDQYPRDRVPFLLWPVVLFNWMLEYFLCAFGPPGRWLASETGKDFLGWCGLLMIIGAAAWGVVLHYGGVDSIPWPW